MGDLSTTAQEEAPFPLTDTDRWVLSLTDEEYAYHTWDELKTIIGKFYLWHHLYYLLFIQPACYQC